MMKELNETNLKLYKNGPLYARIRDLLLDYIAEQPEEEEYLPFEYELEKLLNVSRQSIRRALQELRGAGMIETVRNRGSRILRRTAETTVNSGSVFANKAFASLFLSDTEDETRTGYLPWSVAAEMEKILNTHGATLELFNLRSLQYANREEEVLSHLCRQDIRTVLVYFHERMNPPFWITRLLELGIKPVLLFRDTEQFRRNLNLYAPGVDFIAINHEESIQNKLNRSFQKAEKLCYVIHPEDMPWGAMRLNTVRSFAENHSIPFELLLANEVPKTDIREDRLQIGYELFMDYAKRMNPAERTVFFGANDNYAIGIITAMNELNLQNSGIQVIGYDNLLQSRSANVSTFDYNARGLAEATVELFQLSLRQPEASREKSTGIFVRSIYIKRKTAD